MASVPKLSLPVGPRILRRFLQNFLLFEPRHRGRRPPFLPREWRLRKYLWQRGSGGGIEAAISRRGGGVTITRGGLGGSGVKLLQH